MKFRDCVVSGQEEEGLLNPGLFVSVSADGKVSVCCSDFEGREEK